MITDVLCLDAEPDAERIAFYAELFEGTSQKITSIIDERFSGERSQDFYKGMFAALEAIQQINTSSHPITAGVYESKLQQWIAKKIIS